MFLNRILIVEKTDVTLKKVKKFYKPAYLNILHSKLAKNSYKVAINNTIDFIIIDHTILVNNKFPLLEMLFKNNETKHIPIILINTSNTLSSSSNKKITTLPVKFSEVDLLTQINILLLKKNKNTSTLLEEKSGIKTTYNTDLLFQESSFGIAFLDENGAIKKVNKSFLKITNFRNEDVVNQPFENLLDIKEDRLDFSLQNRILEKKATFDFKTTINNRQIAINTTFVYKDATHKRFQNGVAVITDVTKSEQSIINKMELASITNSCLIAIFKLDKKGIILSWNSGAEEIFQYTKQEIVGQSFEKIVPVDTLSESKQIIENIFTETKETHFTRTGIKKDGTNVTVLFTMSPIKIQNNSIESIYVFGKDTTGIKRLTDELKNYKYAIDKSAIVSVTDKEGYILSVNKNFLETHGYSEGEIIGQPHAVLRPNNCNKKQYKVLWKTIQSGKIWRGELLEKSKNGKEYWMDATITPFIDNKGIPFKFMMVRHDITQKKEVEEKERLNVLMDKSLKMKDEFMANMSHEIRTPLNVILGYSDLLLESTMTNEQYKQISTVKKSGKLLLSVINDILDLSKLESGKLILDDSAFNLQELVLSVKDMLELEANKKELNFKIIIASDIPKFVSGDATRIEQILVNIINNAIKFTKIGYVKVTVKLIKTENKRAQIEFKISDSGIGIAKEKIDTIFESFTQTSRYITREFGGTGLGLTIVKKLVTQLHGSINVESTINKGSDFIIRIPFVIPTSEELETTNTPVIAAQNNTAIGNLNLNILLAEDNEYNQILAETRLNSWNCNVDIANNGLEAIEKLRKNDYHLILMDIQMPIMNGYEATKRIRTEFTSYKKEIPIIALTAHASNGDAKIAKKLGFNDYLFKPFNLKLLHNKLKQYGSLAIEIEDNEQEFGSQEVSKTTKNSTNIEKAVDFNYIESEALGHPNIVKMLVESFVREFDLFIINATEANEQKDWHGVYKAVHRIGPSVSNFNIKSIKPYTTSLYELSKKEENTETYKELIDTTKEAFKDIRSIFTKKLFVLEKEILKNAI